MARHRHRREYARPERSLPTEGREEPLGAGAEANGGVRRAARRCRRRRAATADPGVSGGDGYRGVTSVAVVVVVVVVVPVVVVASVKGEGEGKGVITLLVMAPPLEASPMI